MRARLVELDARNVTLARQAAQAAGLHGVEVLQADAGVTDACAGAVPAQIVVACGIFGNITDSDIQATVAALPSLCAQGALVLWTRHRSPPDLTPAIRSWFGEAGFREEAFDTSHDGFMSVGAHRLAGEPAALALGQRLFTFPGGTQPGPQLDHVVALPLARRVSASAKTDHAPVVLGWSMQAEHSPFQCFPLVLREASEHAGVERSHASEHEQGGPARFIRRPRSPQHLRGTRAAGLPGEIRVRVAAAGLNPMDWIMTADAGTAARFGLSLPAGFGTDYAGVVDQVGDGVTTFAPGMRVFGGALSRAVADFVVVDAGGSVAANEAHRTPDGVDDHTAATLAIAGRTAAAALAVVNPGRGDTVLIGGAAGGVGAFAVQLARLAGARVIGTGSAASSDFLRGLGAEPVAYGDGLANRVRTLAVGRVTAAIDLYGTETVHAARELGVPDGRICTIAAQVDGITAANGANAAPGALEEVARLIAVGQLRVPMAASFPVEQIRTAVELQASRHVHGKVVIDL